MTDKTGVSRRRFIANTAALSAVAIAAPYVRRANAAGKLSIGLWDHWVPGANEATRKLVEEWAEKEKVEVQMDFITSQGNKLRLTTAAEALAGYGHDIHAFSTWLPDEYADHPEPVDDILGPQIETNGAITATVETPVQTPGK